MKLYSSKKVDFTQEPMFFGSDKNTQRFDVMKYKFFDKNNDNQLARFWRPEEISLIKDKADFEASPEHIQFIYKKTLQKLIFLDSLQGRSPFSTFAQLTTLPELENVILTWTFFEGAIHSRSYSHNLRNVFSDPSKVFDETFDDELLMKHADTISHHYNKLHDYVIEYQYNDMKGNKHSKKFMKDMKTQMILAFINVNILEGIRFYPGFASIWGMSEGLGIFNGTSKILKLICRDENQHLALVQKIINILKKTESEGFTSLFEELEPRIEQMYEDALQQEHEWAEYIFSHGSFIGLNDVLIKQYMDFITVQRMKAIGQKAVVQSTAKNPLPWIDAWITESAVEGTPQESEVSDYVMGGFNKDKKADYSRFRV